MFDRVLVEVGDAARDDLACTHPESQRDERRRGALVGAIGQLRGRR